MAKAKPNHMGAFAAPPSVQHTVITTQTVETVELPGEKHAMLLIKAQPCGGFAVGLPHPENFGRSGFQTLASFTTLSEALAWLGDNIAQPAKAGA